MKETKKKLFKTINKWKLTPIELSSIINSVTEFQTEYAGENASHQKYYDKLLDKLNFALNTLNIYRESYKDKEFKIVLSIKAEETAYDKIRSAVDFNTKVLNAEKKNG